MKLGPLIVVQVTHRENICFYIVMWMQTAWLCMTLTQEQSAELLLSACQIAQEFNRQILDWMYVWLKQLQIGGYQIIKHN